MKYFTLAATATAFAALLAGCSWDQAQPVATAIGTAACAGLQTGIVTAQANAAVMNNQTLVNRLTTAQTLAQTDCAAAQALVASVIAAGKAAQVAAAPVSK